MPTIVEVPDPIPRGHKRVTCWSKQLEYFPIPAILDGNGKATSCWRMTWIERLRILLCGRVYCQLWTFGNPAQPQRIFTSIKEI